MDFDFVGYTDSSDDALLANSIERSGRVVLPVRYVGSGQSDLTYRVPSADAFTRHSKIGSIAWRYNYQNAVWQVPYASKVNGQAVPSFSAMLAQRNGGAEQFYIPDYSLELASIPTFSAADLIAGRFKPDDLSGKDVVIGQVSDLLGDIYYIPGRGHTAGAYIHIVGAETLKRARPLVLGWAPLLAVAWLIAALTLLRLAERRQLLVLGLAATVMAIGPALLEVKAIYVDVAPALFILAITATALVRQRFRSRGLVDPTSGLPNLTALKANRAGRDKALIAARVLNYAEIVATLPPNSERQLVEQIVSRLSVGAPERVHYHGDGGIFAWFEDAKMPFGHHLEALYALFRNPVRVDGLAIDLSISFGVEIGSSRSLANRLGSALLAAEEAAHDGLKWKFYDPHSLANASWKLSMLSQLDEAIDRNEVWIAYQPKVDLKTRKIIGAEALARWSHPEKGPIAASEFVAAAEQHDRIGKLTAFVLESAIAAAAAINKSGREFEIAVNLSGRLLGDRGLVGRIAILLDRHGLAPDQLTLELTETAALAGSGDALDLLAQLRELGLKISIDDYGTGLSTLDYLKRIPASEIKIDQSFIKGMTDSRAERLMVQSTIALAHSLERRVVAEGVESSAALELLAEMECDVAQGFILGRPMSLDSLKRRLASERNFKVA